MEALCLQVCVHQGTIYPIGQVWEEGCDVCTCTDLEDAVMGLRVAQCSQKPCEESCQLVRKTERLGAMWSSQLMEEREEIPGRGKTTTTVTTTTTKPL